MSQPQRITIATADATALGGFSGAIRRARGTAGRNMPMPARWPWRRQGRRTGPGHHQRRDLGALPLLLALRRIPARPRLRCADLRLSRHRRIAAGVDARLPGVLDGLGPEGFRGGADLCPARVSRPAGGRGRAQHRRFRDRAGAVQPSPAAHLHHGGAVRLLARLRAGTPAAHAGQMAPGHAGPDRLPGLLSAGGWAGWRTRRAAWCATGVSWGRASRRAARRPTARIRAWPPWRR